MTSPEIATLKLTNAGGKSLDFSKSECLVNISASSFAVLEDYKQIETSLSAIGQINCNIVDFDLKGYSELYEDAVEEVDYNLSDEIRTELKVIQEQ